MTTPRVKTETTTVESPKSKCGDNWDKNVKVRNPYHGVDKHARSLLSLAETDLVTARDAEIAGQLELERMRAQKLLADHKSILNSTQRKNIETYLDRARIYIKDAAKIQDLWATGFATGAYGLVQPFPIHINVSDIGNGFCMGKPPGYQAKSDYEFNCPKFEEVQGHAKDAEKWTALIVAAMKNIRCADEVVRKAEVLQLNKSDWQKTAPKTQEQFEGTGTISAAAPTVEPQPMPTVPGKIDLLTPAVAGGLVGGTGPSGSPRGEPGTAVFDPAVDPAFTPEPEDLPSPGEASIVADEEDVGEGALEEEDVEEAVKPASKKKKKNGRVALIAVVGIGALLAFK